MASIEQRGKHWRALIRKTGHKTVSKTFKTKMAAEIWATKIENTINGGEQVRLQEARSMTVRQVFEQFRDKVCDTRKGGHWEKVRIDRLLRTADFVRRRLDQLSPADIRDWRDERLKEISNASVNRELNLISGIFSHAIKEWSAPFKENPVHLVKRPKGTGTHRNKRWHADDLETFLQACQFDEAKQPRVGMDYLPFALLIAIETAMRPSELCILHIRDVNLTERYARLYDSKNGDPRDVPLSRRAVELFTKVISNRPGVAKVIPVKVRTLGVYYRQVRDTTGLGDLRFYDARHEAATRLSKKLPNVLELSAVTGHRSLQSLKRYYNPTASELAKKLD